MPKKTVAPSIALYHVGTLVQCDHEGCSLNKTPRTFVGSGDEFDAADSFASNHERRNADHFCALPSIYSRYALRG